MFHGIAERPGAEKYTPEEHGVGRGASLPLSIIRPGNDIPALCMPQSNMVVNDNLASLLSGVGNVVLLPVKFAKLFECKYKKGNMSWYDRGMAPGNPTKFALNASDERIKFEPVGEYFEVLATRYKDVQDKFDNCSRFRFDDILGTLDDEDQAYFDVSSQMLDRHPVIRNRYTIISEKAFAIVERYIDRDFFSVTEAQRV